MGMSPGRIAEISQGTLTPPYTELSATPPIPENASAEERSRAQWEAAQVACWYWDGRLHGLFDQDTGRIHIFATGSADVIVRHVS